MNIIDAMKLLKSLECNIIENFSFCVQGWFKRRNWHELDKSKTFIYGTAEKQAGNVSAQLAECREWKQFFN